MNPKIPVHDSEIPEQGLTDAQAQSALAEFGPNALPHGPSRSLLGILKGVLSEPMFLLLVLAAALYLLIGNLQEGLLLAGFAVLSIGLVVWQEARSERALEALRALGAPTARVQRSGRELRVEAAAVVPGDLLLVSEGERIAADARLVRCEGLAIDESLLTGESVAVDKSNTQEVSVAAPGNEIQERSSAFAGTLVVRGHGSARVVATGGQTRAGKIGLSLASIETGPTPLQRSSARMLRWFGLGALLMSLLVVVLYGWKSGDWLLGAQSGIAVAMALLPEEFPMVLAIFLAIGAWRLSRIKVLARRPAVVETLGATSVLCVDKTGTLTENRMRLRALMVGEQQLTLSGDEIDLPEDFHRLLEFGLLASRRKAIDPMDLALGQVGQSTLIKTEHLHGEWPLVREYGLSAELPVFSRVWRDPSGRQVLATKGAPEAIAGLCGMDAAARAHLLQQVELLATAGLRVLAVATTQLPDGQLPEQLAGLNLEFIGLLGFEDPLRSTAAAAVAEAQGAGIKVIMITGDHPATALAIAGRAGIETAGGVITGQALGTLDEAALASAVRQTRIFARIRPEQKLRLVQALQAQGEIVAMTGDGVNDAPALKAAHIGLAMGSRATDVAREAAGIVLLDDDFGHLVAGVRSGRRIFDNLRKVMIYIVAIHVPIAGLALLPLLFGLPPLLLPAHVVLIEMVIDPICAIAFENEPEEPDLMRRPPRQASESLLAIPQFVIAVIQGVLLLLVSFGLYLSYIYSGATTELARTMAFLALTAGNLLLVRVNATHAATLPRLFSGGHRAYWLIATIAGTIVAACVYVPALTQLFRFATPSLAQAGLAVAAGCAAVLVFDLLKWVPAVRESLSVRTVVR